MAIDVSSGSFPVTFAPPERTPFPASAMHQSGHPDAVHSVSVCAPYFATEKPQSFCRAFGVQPMSGTVRIGSPPAARVSVRNRSAADPSGRAPGLALSSGTFMKNQSIPLFDVSFCQL